MHLWHTAVLEIRTREFFKTPIKFGRIFLIVVSIFIDVESKIS